MLDWLTSHIAALSALGASVAFIWSTIQFIDVRRREQRAHEFEAFHRLVKELVAPDEKTGTTWIDRQMAVVFELRHFPRYYEVSWRILIGLREAWGPLAGDRLSQEIELTLAHIKKRKPNLPLQRAGSPGGKHIEL